MKQTGQCLVSCIPVRADASSRSEIVTQLLYGETYSIREQKDDWYVITTHFDQYSGWISANQHSEPSFEPKSIQNKSLFEQRNGIIIPFGSYWTEESNSDLTPIEASKIFLNCPYLWGGRTFMGIDCSGFMQVIHKACGKKLPRDASQQAEICNRIDFGERKAGDLAFFKNGDGKITHVGLLLDKDRIVHASGKVRIDELTNQGIIHSETKIRTHILECVARL
ncbi:MAG: C40 family peptidase [Flavobacteriales bacterium]|nr:C40 family peptidase [Flavobacteriales bacterium]